MNFFEHQEAARSQSKKLIILFIIAIILVCGLINLFVYFGHQYFFSGSTEALSSTLLWKIHLIPTGITLLIILGGSFYQISRLSHLGGISIALDLGGKNITHENANLSEKTLLNIVEEMSIASGIRVPEVFVLDEPGINAFAAGFKTKDAVVAVSRGALETLTRDELQGVVAHEFSHIFHGDMALNMKITSVIFGLMILTRMGFQLLRGGSRHTGSRRKGGGEIFMLALALIVIGSLGTFFGRLIQAALSRQREFLADASAVQYTRNPNGIAGALKKIGGWTDQSFISKVRVDEMSHFFIAAPLASRLSGIFATHPPLTERVRRIDPSFRGKFEETKSLTSEQEGMEHLKSHFSKANLEANANISSQEILPEAGSFKSSHLVFVHQLIEQISPFVKSACQTPYTTRAICFSILISNDPQVAQKQFDTLKERKLQDIIDTIKRSHAEYLRLGPHSRLVLLDLALPALKKLSREQRQFFLSCLSGLIEADKKFEFFEYCVLKILSLNLKEDRKNQRNKVASAHAIKNGLIALFSRCAQLSRSVDRTTTLANKKQVALQKIISDYHLKIENLSEIPSLRSLDQAFESLTSTPLAFRKRVLTSCIDLVSSDQTLTSEEVELIRALADCFEIPIPPLLAPPQ